MNKIYRVILLSISKMLIIFNPNILSLSLSLLVFGVVIVHVLVCMWFLLQCNVPISLYFSLVHQRGTVAVMDFLRKVRVYQCIGNSQQLGCEHAILATISILP